MTSRFCAAALLCLAFFAEASAAGDTPPSHCPADQTRFACPTAHGRVLALCHAADNPVFYRFGRIGAVDLQYPPSAQPQAEAMVYAEYHRYQTDRVEVRFDHQGTEYTVFDYRENGVRRAGVRVASVAGKEREIACNTPITGRLDALKDQLPCDADSALNLGACK
jgi:hypothetical protein